MCGRIAGVGADGLLQRLGRLALLAIGCIEHGQVVIRLRHVRIVACQSTENLDRLRALLLLGGDHATQKTHFHIARVLLQKAVGLFGSLVSLALLQQMGHLVDRPGRLRGQVVQCHATAQQYSGPTVLNPQLADTGQRRRNRRRDLHKQWISLQCRARRPQPGVWQMALMPRLPPASAVRLGWPIINSRIQTRQPDRTARFTRRPTAGEATNRYLPSALQRNKATFPLR